MKTKKKIRKFNVLTSKYAPTVCLRVDLGHGRRCGSQPPWSFMRDLRGFDRQLELFWLPGISRWVLYRLVRTSPCRQCDMLVLEFVLQGARGEMVEPSGWLIDLLKKWDKTRNGSVDPRIANRQYLSEVMARNQRWELDKEKQLQEAAHDMTVELDAYAMRMRKNFHMEWN